MLDIKGFDKIMDKVSCINRTEYWCDNHSWACNISAAYGRGIFDGAKNKKSNVNNEIFKAAYTQGYNHGQKSEWIKYSNMDIYL